MNFNLVQGVDADNLEGLHSAYSFSEFGISAILSGELIYPIVCNAVRLLKEPVFFFMELPCSQNEEKKLRKNKSDPYHYNIYYLDGCTIPVAEAIMERYGVLLINDGLCRFGFASHATNEEIYCLNYQELSIYGDKRRYESVFKNLDVPFEKKIKTMWDNFSNEAPGSSAAVEINGENVYNIVDNLKAEGMYFSETR